jgi:hypothetical protein
MQGGESLGVGDSLQSGDGNTSLVLQADGNAVLYCAQRALWTTQVQRRCQLMTRSNHVWGHPRPLKPPVSHSSIFNLILSNP